MINENKTLLKAEIKRKKSSLKQRIFESTKKFYEINYYIINCKKGYLWWHILSLVIEYLQVMAFILDDTLLNLWKQTAFINNIKLISKYIFIVPLIKYNKIIYITVLNVILIVVILFSLTSVILIIIGKINIKTSRQLLIVFKIFLEGVSFTFFGHLIFLIFTIFVCENDNKSYFDANLECRSGLLYKIDSVLGIITLILLLGLSVFSISTLFIPNFVNNYEANDVLKKTNKIGRASCRERV